MEAAAEGVLEKKVFLKESQISKQKIGVGVCF